MNDELISHIEELGLSNKEARVYVACLKIGPSAVQRIADQSGIKRVTTYVILESLVGMGMVSQSIKGKKTYFVAEDPSNLKRLLEKREKELIGQKASFAKILPQLQGLKTVPKELPEVKFYDGQDGVLSLFRGFYSDYQGALKDIYAFSNIDQVHEFYPERALGKANPDRMQHDIRSHIIYTSQQGPIYKHSDKLANRESRFIPLEKYFLTGEVDIIGDYVVLISFTGSRPIGVTIRNSDMAAGMKAIFDMCWIMAEQFNKD